MYVLTSICHTLASTPRLHQSRAYVGQTLSIYVQAMDTLMAHVAPTALVTIFYFDLKYYDSLFSICIEELVLYSAGMSSP